MEKKRLTSSYFRLPSIRTTRSSATPFNWLTKASGESVTHKDKWADRLPYNWFFGLDQEPVHRETIEVIFPPHMPRNRALWVALSLWRKEGDAFLRQKILSSDLPLLSDTQVILGQFVLPAEAAVSSSVPVARFENGFTLDAIDFPERARAGETALVSVTWRADKDGLEDAVQFLHFGHEESGAWWVHDQQPLGARLPTQLWYSGLADTESWSVTLPADLAPGRYAVYTGLYRASDQVRLPAIDAEGIPFVDARVPLGVLIVEGA